MVKTEVRKMINEIIAPIDYVVLELQAFAYAHYRLISLALATSSFLIVLISSLPGETIYFFFVFMLWIAWFMLWLGSYTDNLLNEHYIRLLKDYEKVLIERVNTNESEGGEGVKE